MCSVRDRRLIPGLAFLLALGTAALASTDPGAGSDADPSGSSLDSVVRIGLLAAGTAEAADVAAGAAAAARALNDAGGIDGRRFEVLPIAADGPWRDGASRSARLIFEQDLAALIGPPDTAGAHLAAQLATRARLPLISLSPAPGPTLAGSPWVFRGVPGDAEQMAALLASHEVAGARSAWLAIPDGREGDARAAAVQPACAKAGIEITATLRAAGTVTPPGQAPDLLLLWLDSEPARRLLERLGDRLPPVIGGSMRLAGSRFARWARRWRRDRRRPHVLVAQLPTAGGRDPGWALGHDVLTLLGSAARAAGTDPVLLRDAVAGGSFEGLTGPIRFGPRGERTGRVPVTVIRPEGYLH